jgi:predicted enzyme related to lactoylglutathione lyase
MIGLSQDLGKARQPTAGATEIVFSVPAVKAAWRALKEKGVAFVHDPRQLTEKEWGATFADPDGHYLTIFGPPGE